MNVSTRTAAAKLAIPGVVSETDDWLHWNRLRVRLRSKSRMKRYTKEGSGTDGGKRSRNLAEKREWSHRSRSEANERLRAFGQMPKAQ